MASSPNLSEVELMGEFFKGWRRKTGLVTLVLACALMAEWVRSRSVEDNLCVRLDDDTVELLTSSRFGLTRTRIVEPEGDQIHVRFFFQNQLPGDWNTSRPWFIEQLRGLPGPDNTFFVWHAPHWTIILPLTLLSACLLLSKPRKAKPTAEST